MFKSKLLLSAIAMTLSTTAFTAVSETRHLVLPQDNLQTLCEYRATQTTAAYHQRASLYGLTRQQLRRLEQTHVCASGERLGEVKSTWQPRS